ncbi:MAG: hypothetical protein SFU86_16930 [Pirellulaceae bacterium]|nr:hypothetical protein [Pirellulaceae bacterium]
MHPHAGLGAAVEVELEDFGAGGGVLGACGKNGAEEILRDG